MLSNFTNGSMWKWWLVMIILRLPVDGKETDDGDGGSNLEEQKS